jgi:hypothetical protein
LTNKIYIKCVGEILPKSSTLAIILSYSSFLSSWMSQVKIAF